MKRWFFIGIPLVALLVFIGWRISQKKAEAAKQVTERKARGNAPVLVDTIAVSRRDVVKTFEAVGTVESPNAVEVTPKVSGRVLFLQAREGDKVQAGQVLARLDSAEIEAEVRQKEATVAQAQQRLAEAQLTERPTVVGLGTDVQKQQAGLLTAQAQTAQARADYEAQIVQAQAAVTDAQNRITSAQATVAQADAAIQTAQANLDNVRVKLDRQQTLYREGATAKQNVDDAQTAVEVAEAAVNEAKRRREGADAAVRSAQAQKVASQKNVSVVRNKANATVATANAAVATARANVAASQANTAGRKPAYQANLAALTAAVRAAEADLRVSQARLGDTTLRSPLTGVVSQRNVDVGALASPSQSLMTVQAINPLWVTAGLPEELSRKVFVGQTAPARFDALPGKTIPGVVAEINPAADPQSRQFALRVRVQNPDNRIRPGMFGRVTLTTDRAANALVVPLEAVKKSDKPGAASTVTVVSASSTAQVRPVQTGLSDNKMIAVTSGLESGEKVVILSGRDLKDGQSVKTGKDAKAGGRGAASEQKANAK